MAVAEEWPWNYLPLEIQGNKYKLLTKDVCISVRKAPQNESKRHTARKRKSIKTINIPKYRSPRLKRRIRPLVTHSEEETVRKSKPVETLRRNCVCSCKEFESNDNEEKHNYERFTLTKEDFYHLNNNELLKTNLSVDIHRKCESADQEKGRVSIKDIKESRENAAVLKSGVLTTGETIQLLKILDTREVKQQKITLKLILKLLKYTTNAQLFLNNGLLEELIKIVLMGDSDELQSCAVCCISELVAYEELTSLWWEPMLLSGTEALQRLLSSKRAVRPEYLVQAALMALIDITKNVEMAGLLIRNGLDEVINLTVWKKADGHFTKHVSTRGLAVKFLTRLMGLGSEIASMFLLKYSAGLHHIGDILQYNPCQEQQEALRFFAAISLFAPGLEAIVTHHALEQILWVLICSRCRHVRELASQVLRNISTYSDKGLIMKVFKQVCHEGSSLRHAVKLQSMSHAQESKDTFVLKDNNTTKVKTSKDERTVAALVPFLVIAFQVDSVEKSSKDREFCGPAGSGKWDVLGRNRLTGKYSSCLRVNTNILATLRNILNAVEHDSVDAEGKERVNLEYAALMIKYGALGCVEQLNSLTKKLLKINHPSSHTIDPTTLPPRGLFSTTTITPLETRGIKKLHHDYGFNQLELDFVCEVLKLLIVLSRSAAGSEFDLTVEEEKVFQDSKPKPSKQKRQISFRKSATLMQNAMRFTQHKARKERNEEDNSNKTRQQAIPSSTASTSASLLERKTSKITEVEETRDELGTEQPHTSEMSNYIRLSLLDALVIQALAPWITCGIWNIQGCVLTLLRYMFHQSNCKSYSPSGVPYSTNSPPHSFTIKQKNNLGQLNKFTSSIKLSNDTNCLIPKKSIEVSHLCVKQFIQHCGPYLLDLLSHPATPTQGKSCLMVMRAAVFNGAYDTRLKLIKMGCFGRIIEFIRTNENTAQALGILIIRVLVTSDRALQQLFVAHGGLNLVMALHEYKESLVKEEAAYLLATFTTETSSRCIKRTKVFGQKKRNKRIHPKPGSQDIWDRVSAKWEVQDQVYFVLKKSNVRF